MEEGLVRALVLTIFGCIPASTNQIISCKCILVACCISEASLVTFCAAYVLVVGLNKQILSIQLGERMSILNEVIFSAF